VHSAGLIDLGVVGTGVDRGGDAAGSCAGLGAMGVAGRVFQTEGIAALSPADQSAIREKVETFDAFTLDNDPYGQHDFGSFEHNGIRVFWKIDYYDRNLEYGSEDPSDPAQTTRVLTIMLAGY
jgi:hypothetical protein